MLLNKHKNTLKGLHISARGSSQYSTPRAVMGNAEIFVLNLMALGRYPGIINRETLYEEIFFV